MFGKPEWFRPACCGMGLYPSSRQGWIYSLGWLSVLLVPVLLLVLRGQKLEAGVWLLFALVGFVWDARSIAREMKRKDADRDLFVIDENETESKAMETRNYELHIRE